MAFVNKVLFMLHEGDSYEITVSQDGQIVEIWRYALNQTRKPDFVRFEWLDPVLQERIHDRVVREVS